MALMKLLFDHCEFRCPNHQLGCKFRYSGGDRTISLSHRRECNSRPDEFASSKLAPVSSATQHTSSNLDDSSRIAQTHLDNKSKLEKSKDCDNAHFSRPRKYSDGTDDVEKQVTHAEHHYRSRSRSHDGHSTARQRSPGIPIPKMQIFAGAELKPNSLPCFESRQSKYDKYLHFISHEDIPKNTTKPIKIHPGQRRLFQTRTDSAEDT